MFRSLKEVEREMERREFLIEFLPSLLSRFNTCMRVRGGPIVRLIEDFPAYLPELGVSLLIRADSPSVACRLRELRQSGAAVFKARLYNVDLERREAVTRGQISEVNLSNASNLLYSVASVFNLLLHPSAMLPDGRVVSERWLPLRGGMEFEFACGYFVNLFLVFVQRRDLDSAGGGKIWLGRTVHLRHVPAKFIQLRPEGRIRVRDVELSFEEGGPQLSSLQEWSRDRPAGHYLCLSEGIGTYWTSCPDVTSTRRHLNLVTGVLPFFHTPYEILPLLFPFQRTSQEGLLLETSIPAESLSAIGGKLERFGGAQWAWVSNAYQELARGLARVKQESGRWTLRLVNPAVVAYLVKHLAQGDNALSSRIEEALNQRGLLEMIETGDPYFDLIAPGVGEILELRQSLLRRA
jgi:hypothetical protein